MRALGLLVRAPNAGLPIQSLWVAIMNRQAEIARKLVAKLAVQASEADPQPDVSAFFTDPLFA